MLTDLQIARLKWRPDRYCVMGFDKCLRLAVHPRGRRTWQLRCVIFAKQTVLTLGYWPEMTVKAARAKAKVMMEAIARGENPRRVSAANVTVSAFAGRWLREVVSKARKDAQPIERRLERDVLHRLGQLRLAQVDVDDVRELVFAKRERGKPAAAVALRDLLFRMFEYARVNGLIPVNPAAALERKFIARLHSRSRALSEDELRNFYNHVYVMSIRTSLALELLLLTLARKSELLNAQWQHVDLQRGIWEVPAGISKSGRPHLVYLSLRAIEIFKALGAFCRLPHRGYVFAHHASETQPMAVNLLNKAIKRVDWGMPAFTPHDLRRTASTHLNEKGYPPDVIEKALNHAVRGGVRGVYNRAQYAVERKKMLEEWAQYLEGLKGNKAF